MRDQDSGRTKFGPVSGHKSSPANPKFTPVEPSQSGTPRLADICGKLNLTPQEPGDDRPALDEPHANSYDGPQGQVRGDSGANTIDNDLPVRTQKVFSIPIDKVVVPDDCRICQAGK